MLLPLLTRFPTFLSPASYFYLLLRQIYQPSAQPGLKSNAKKKRNQKKPEHSQHKVVLLNTAPHHGEGCTQLSFTTGKKSPVHQTIPVPQPLKMTEPFPYQRGRMEQCGVTQWSASNHITAAAPQTV